MLVSVEIFLLCFEFVCSPYFLRTFLTTDTLGDLIGNSSTCFSESEDRSPMVWMFLALIRDPNPLALKKRNKNDDNFSSHISSSRDDSGKKIKY